MNLFNTEIPNLYKKNKIKCDLLLNFWLDLVTFLDESVTR